MYIHTYIHCIHTHTHIYIYMYIRYGDSIPPCLTPFVTLKYSNNLPDHPKQIV